MITLHFEKLYSSPRIAEPCFIGIPLAKGALYQTDEIRLYDENQNQLPSQTKITSTWEDGSIRYLFTRFLVNLPANKGCDVQYCLTKGEWLTNTDTKAAPAKMACHETSTGFHISTEALSFAVDHHTQGIFSALKTDTHVYSSKNFQGPFLTNGNDDNYAFYGHKWNLIETGDVCTILSCKGSLLEQSELIGHKNEQIAENSFLQDAQASPLPCEIRITAYAGKPWVDVAIRLINATSKPLEIKEYLFSFHNTDSKNNPPRTCVASSNYKTDFIISDQGETVEKEITANMLLNQGNEHFAEVMYGTFFADWTNEDAGVCATIFQAHQNYPKAVFAHENGFDVFLVPQTDTPVLMQSGMAKEQRFQLHFHEASIPLEALNNRSLIYQMPDRPLLDPDVFEKAKVMPDIFVQNKDTDAEIALIQCADSHARSYGMLHWGDAPDPGYTSQGKGHGKPVWTNNEYDFPHACMLLYAKNATRRFLDYALVAGEHQRDIDVCHYSEDPLKIGGQWEHSNDHVLDTDIVCSHEWVEGILDCYHATGDERYLETALGIGENVLVLLDTPAYQKNGGLSARETGWALRSLTALYTETRDLKWVEKCDWIVSEFKEWADRFGGWLAPYTDNVVIRVPFMISVAVGSLMRYYREFPKDDIRVMILSAVDDMIDNCLMDNGLFYYKELPSLNRLGNNPLPLEALAIAYELTKDTKYLDAGLKTYERTMKSMSNSGGGGKKQIGDAVISGNAGTKQFAQTFIPFATYYKALHD